MNEGEGDMHRINLDDNAMLASLFKATPDLLMVLDRDLRIKTCNWFEHTLVPAEEYGEHIHCYEVFMRRDTQCENCQALDVFETGEQIQFPGVNPVDGAVLETTVFPIKDDDGEVQTIAVNVRNISSRRHSEHELRRMAGKLCQVIDNAVCGMRVIWHDKSLVRTNDAYFRMFGLERWSVPGKMCSEAVPHNHCNSPECMLDRILAGEEECEYELEHELEDGSTIAFVIRGTPFKAPDGKVVGIIQSFLDITRIKQAELDTSESQRRLAQVEKLAAIGELASGIAHELNQPLNHIDITAQLLEKQISKGKLDEDELHSEMQKIRENIHRAVVIIKSLRDFTSKATSDPVPFDVRESIQNAVLMFGTQLKTGNVQLTIDMPDKPVIAMGSTHRTGQVIINLITNARDALDACTDNGEIRINVTLGKHESGVVIKLADNGIGIPEEMLPNIFTPFNTSKDQGEGSGLGLSICHRIVENCGGSIEIESEEDVGTTVTVILRKPPERTGVD